MTRPSKQHLTDREDFQVTPIGFEDEERPHHNISKYLIELGYDIKSIKHTSNYSIVDADRIYFNVFTITHGDGGKWYFIMCHEGGDCWITYTMPESENK